MKPLNTQNQTLISAQILELERIRRRLGISIDRISRKLRVEPYLYKRWAKGLEDPSKQGKTKSAELGWTLKKQFPYCPHQRPHLGQLTAKKPNSTSNLPGL